MFKATNRIGELVKDRAAPVACLLICLYANGLRAAEDQAWQTAISRMPLTKQVTELNRTNILDTLLNSFRSNDVVKALIYMPGATDEWFMPHHSRVGITNANPSLLDALNALASQTRIRAAFRPPFLLIYTDLDQLEPVIKVADQATAEKIKNAPYAPHLLFKDCDWDAVEPSLHKYLKTAMRPWRYSKDSWHFYRHSFSEWNLTGWEALEAVALAARTTCTIQHKKVVFEVDHRLPPREAETRQPLADFETKPSSK